MATKNEIQVFNLDAKKISEINSEMNKLRGLPGGGVLHLRLFSTDGDITDAIDISSTVHNEQNIDFTTEASGTVSSAGTILTAAGKPSTREAKFGTKFILNPDGPYPPNTTASGLSADGKTVLDTLGSLTGKRKAILDHIIKGLPISALEAKKCRIIDKVGKFQSKYRTAGRKAGKVNPAAQNASGNTINSNLSVDPSVSQNLLVHPNHHPQGNQLPPPPVNSVPLSNLNSQMNSNQTVEQSYQIQNSQAPQNIPAPLIPPATKRGRPKKQ